MMKSLKREGTWKHVTMAAGLIRVKRQAVGRVVTTLVTWNTRRPTFTHQFSQFTLQQSWWRQGEAGRREVMKYWRGWRWCLFLSVLAKKKTSFFTTIITHHSYPLMDRMKPPRVIYQPKKHTWTWLIQKHTYGSRSHPLHEDSRERRHSAVWRAGSDHSNTGNVQ